MIGIYTSDKPMGRDDESYMIIHPAVESYYNHDDVFAHCKDHTNVVKSKLKDIIYRMSGVVG